ncbi:MAG: hypothetical protein AB200_00795 [Parcubacteria bacterium C7867-005]|nr:MAG: hypothetical protein AB200_00795 [Parcubacteria bacterium C7867-005]
MVRGLLDLARLQVFLDESTHLHGRDTTADDLSTRAPASDEVEVLPFLVDGLARAHDVGHLGRIDVGLVELFNHVLHPHPMTDVDEEVVDLLLADAEAPQVHRAWVLEAEDSRIEILVRGYECPVGRVVIDLRVPLT